MHMQSPVPGWTGALLKMPDYSLVKAFDAGVLQDAKQKWAAAGRDPGKLITLFRHFDMVTAPEGTWAEAVAHWRRMFNRFVDRTYLERYAPFVDFVSESNEYTAESTWADPVERAKALRNMEAAAYVWNTAFRGKWVTAADGARGFISDTCKLVLMSGPMGNRFPREVFEIARKYDCPIDYHAYMLIYREDRHADDFKNVSGLWNTLERAYGIQVQWIFGECGPALSTFEGWRHPNVLGGDQALLAGYMRDWVRDIASTAAYREGRVLGTGAWFTSGGGPQWNFYELEAAQLNAIAEAIRDEWRPGAPIPPEEDDMTDAQKAVIREVRDGLRADADRLDALLGPQPLYEAVTLGDLVLRDSLGNPAHTADRTLAQPGVPGDVVKKGTSVKVYKDDQTAGAYTNRAWVTPDGLNVTTVSGGQPMLRRL